MTPIIKHLPLKAESEKRKAELLTIALDCFAIAFGMAVLVVLYVVL